MNPNAMKNAENLAKQSDDYIRAKNKKIRKYNRDVMFRNFLRKNH